MIISGNPLLAGASGKLDNIVVKQYDGKTVVTSIPDMSRRKLSPKQKEANSQMKLAVLHARHIIADTGLKQLASEKLQITPNKVYQAIVTRFLRTGETVFGETEQELRDKQTLKALLSAITQDIPDAEVMLFGDRAKGMGHRQSDWDLLVLTENDHPPARRWELQEKLFSIVIRQGSQVNMLLVQKEKWSTGQEYEVLRARVEKELVKVE